MIYRHYIFVTHRKAITISRMIILFKNKEMSTKTCSLRFSGGMFMELSGENRTAAQPGESPHFAESVFGLKVYVPKLMIQQVDFTNAIAKEFNDFFILLT